MERNAKHEPRTVTVEEVAGKLGKAGVVIIDVNSRRRWMKGHVPGAVNLDPAAYKASDLPGDKNVTLVFYCKDPGCGAARHAAVRAQKMGYPHVFVMPDGIEGWVRAGNAVEQG